MQKRPIHVSPLALSQQEEECQYLYTTITTIILEKPMLLALSNFPCIIVSFETYKKNW
jgi:hypothetical protein